MSPRYLERAPAVQKSREPCLSIMAAVMGFPFSEAVLSVQQSGSVSLSHCVWGVGCCAAPAGGSSEPVLLFQVRRVRGTAQGSILAFSKYPQEHSWTIVSTDTACLLLKSQKKWVLVSQAVVCTRIFHVNFLFSGKLISSFFFLIQ